MSNLYTQIDMLRQERDEARADRDRLATNLAALTAERDRLRAALLNAADDLELEGLSDSATRYRSALTGDVA